jgi:hypothetical protein
VFLKRKKDVAFMCLYCLKANSHMNYTRIFLNLKVHYHVHKSPHWIQSWTKPVHFMSSHSISLGFIILSIHLGFGLPGNPFHSAFPIRKNFPCITYIFSFPPPTILATCRAYLIYFDLIILIILGEEYKFSPPTST